jgi:hypothetical protein
MRRAVSSFAVSSLTASSLAVVTLAAGLAFGLQTPAAAQECNGMGCAHYNYERTRHSPAYGSRYDGYWDRRGERRRHWNRHNHHRYYGGDVHYYPGYGYYSSRGAYYAGRYGHGGRDGHRVRYGNDYRDGGRADWCARRYRSYDYRSGTYLGYDGYRHRCG